MMKEQCRCKKKNNTISSKCGIHMAPFRRRYSYVFPQFFPYLQNHLVTHSTSLAALNSNMSLLCTTRVQFGHVRVLEATDPLCDWRSHRYTLIHTSVDTELKGLPKLMIHFVFHALFLQRLLPWFTKTSSHPRPAHSQGWDSAVLFEQSFLSPAEFMLTFQFAQFAFWKLPSSSF